jgi:redox-sensing transcriptional repressor
MARLKRVVLDRLIRYYRYLAEFAAKQPARTVTSAQIGRALDVDPSQVRKDFAAVGLVGMSRVGYEVCEVCRAIRTVVGFDQPYTAVLVGAGQLGGAIMAYPEFDRYGLRIIAAFDVDPFKVGRRIAGHTIEPIDELPSFVADHHVRLAILVTPVEVAQPLADLLVACGVEAIWNFTPTRLDVPPAVLARNERFSVGLGEIAYHLSQARRPAGPRTGGIRRDCKRPDPFLDTARRHA